MNVQYIVLRATLVDSWLSMLVGSSPGWLGLTVAAQLCVNEQLIESQPTVREAFHSTLDKAHTWA